MPKTICLDFDGVIHDYNKGWQNGEIYGEPLPGSLEAIENLIEEGYNVVILSTRASSDHGKGAERMEGWLRRKYIELYRSRGMAPAAASNAVAQFVFKILITAEKPPAIAYVDDRAIRFTNWPDIRKLFV